MKKIILFIFTLSSFACIGQNCELNVMTFNIRMDNASDGINVWQNRKEFAANCIAFYNADIVGLQEALHHQLNDLKQYLPDYESVGVGRQDGKTGGEYSAILYKKSRFDLIETETFWLSENPEAIGQKGWDAACERVVTWAKLKDRNSGRVFLFVNTHFDHIGQIARMESSKLLLSKIKQIAGGLPAIVTGDFNASATNEAIRFLTDKSNPDGLADTRELAPLKYGPSGSFHNFGRIPPENQSIIDYIFIKGNIQVLRYGILDDSIEGKIYLSDHNPVFCTVLVEK
ncbi:MAG: endonuclease/exonuclease/phosphatase family protein [Dysgonamonadaceae bacterium]|jgi:endonuclease/exonuclease/phosphatase family metal-dependent hydrolase|nr:endonuclease/exonuclease/phosphatase family protein [Dysgonamonadaceae bacterium]